MKFFYDKLDNKDNEEHEKLKKDWGLFDWEADLVQKGEYDPWNFEEPESGEELDEDDYYYEDND